MGVCISQRGEDAHKCHTTIKAAKKSVQIFVQQDAVDGIRRLLDVRTRVLHVGRSYFWSLKQCDCSKYVFFVVNKKCCHLLLNGQVLRRIFVRRRTPSAASFLYLSLTDLSKAQYQLLTKSECLAGALSLKTNRNYNGSWLVNFVRVRKFPIAYHHHHQQQQQQSVLPKGRSFTESGET